MWDGGQENEPSILASTNTWYLMNLFYEYLLRTNHISKWSIYSQVNPTFLHQLIPETSNWTKEGLNEIVIRNGNDICKGASQKKIQDYLGVFPIQGRGGLSSIPKLLWFDQVIFGMPKSFWGAKTCYTIGGRWYLINLITLR